MANFSVEQKRWGLKKEGTRLTAEATATKWFSADPGSDMKCELSLLADNGLRGVRASYPSHSGKLEADGKIVHPLRANIIDDFFQMLLGAPTTTEASVVTVEAGVNDAIDIDEGSGELGATIAAGSYPIGASSATAGTFCAAVKAALDAAGDTYTVTYDSSTRKFTIAIGTGTFKFLWHTGTHAAATARTLLGFSDADTVSAAASIASESAVWYRCYQHVFVPQSSIQPITYTIFEDRGFAVTAYSGCAVKKMDFNGANNDFVNISHDLVAIKEQSGSIGSPSYADELEPLSFQHATLAIGGVQQPSLKSWKLSIDSKAVQKWTQNQTQYATDIINPEVMEISGEMDIYFETIAERTKFLAHTTTYLLLTIEGNVLTGTTKDKVMISLPKIEYVSYTLEEMDNLISAKVTFKAVYDTTTSNLITATVLNKNASI